VYRTPHAAGGVGTIANPIFTSFDLYIDKAFGANVPTAEGFFSIGASSDSSANGQRNNSTISLAITAAGNIQFYRGTTLLQTSTLALLALTQYRFEVAAALADTGGYFKLWVDGVSVFDFSGDTFVNSGTAEARLLKYSSNYATSDGIGFCYSSILIYDGTVGEGPRTAPLGVVMIDALPSVDVALDDLPVDKDTTTVAFSTPGVTDYDVANLADNPTSIVAAQAVFYARTDGTVPRRAKFRAVNGATVTQSPEVSVPASSAYLAYTIPFTPASAAEVNGLKVGVELTC
jgi:hypothetical protein